MKYIQNFSIISEQLITHIQFVGYCDVEFRELSDDEINEYVKTKDPYDKAGGYGI